MDLLSFAFIFILVIACIGAAVALAVGVTIFWLLIKVVRAYLKEFRKLGGKL